MAAKIMIRRRYKLENADAMNVLLKKLRSLALDQPGYMYGETLKRFDKDNESLVISTWQSVDDWRRYVDSEERKELESQIALLTDEPTEYEIYVTP